jgi:hypothetical protein
MRCTTPSSAAHHGGTVVTVTHHGVHRRSHGFILTPACFVTALPCPCKCAECGKTLAVSDTPAYPRLDALLCEVCGYTTCKSCYTSGLTMPSSCPDGTGLTAEPTHWAWGGFTCANCVVFANLGRRVSPGDKIARLCYDLEVQHQLDKWHGRASSTLRGYQSAQLAIRRFGARLGIELFPRPDGVPLEPDLGVVMAWYVLYAMLTGGRTAEGRSLATLEGHRSAYAYYFEMYVHQPPPTSAPDFKLFMKGAGRRVTHATKQAFAFNVLLVTALQNRAAAAVTVDPNKLRYGDPLFEQVYNTLLYICILHVSFLACLRGNEAYLLRFTQVTRDMMIGPSAVSLRCSEHFLLDFLHTKNNFGKTMRVPVVAITRSGVSLKAFLLPFLRMREQLPSPLTALFIRHDLSAIDSAHFLTTFLRPAFTWLRDTSDFGRGLVNVDLSRVETNSLRRGGNTAAATGGVPGFMRRGHGRWRLSKRGSAVRLEMVDLYDEVGIERQLSVTYLMAQEVTVATSFGSPAASRRLDFESRFLAPG